MPKIAGLTDAAVRNATAPAGKRCQLSDWPVSSLILQVSGPPSNHRVWILRPRIHGRQEKITLSPSYPALSLATARERSRAIGTAADAGADLPTLRALAAGADPNAPVIVAPRPVDTIERVIAEFIPRYLEQRNRSAIHIRTTTGIFRNHVLPAWRGRDIKKITRRDIVERLDAVADTAGPIAANRTLSAISKLLRWAASRDILETVPLLGIEKPGEEISRDRVLTDPELRLVWLAASKLGYPFGTFVRLLVLLGQRRSETAGMRWGDVDRVTATWTLPAPVTKGRRVHVVPLAPSVLALLEACPRVGLYVLTASGTAPISGFAKPKTLLNQLAAAEAAAAGLPQPGPWRLHDLRRTATTGMARLGTPRFIVARVLNHTDNSVTGGYDRYENLAEKRTALTAWAEHVAGLTRPHLVATAEVGNGG